MRERTQYPEWLQAYRHVYRIEMNLGKRLESVYALVPEQSVLVDVGSDHGYLPAKLVKDGKIERSAVTDINVGPLESAKKTAIRFEVFEKMTFFLADGLDGVDYDYDTVTICGMGGILIADIIARAPRCRECTLILQAMRHQEYLRKYLWDNGYAITEDICVREGKRLYQVLSAEYSGKKTDYNDAQALVGLAREDECYRELVLHNIAKLSSHAKAKKSAGHDVTHEERLISLLEELI